jgi:uncharacterized protein YcfL
MSCKSSTQNAFEDEYNIIMQFTTTDRKKVMWIKNNNSSDIKVDYAAAGAISWLC